MIDRISSAFLIVNLRTFYENLLNNSKNMEMIRRDMLS